MASLNGLPSFFQASTKTVLDELADFELGGLDEEFELHVSEQLATFDDDNLDSAFGDLNADSLPDFFKNPSTLEQENYDLLDSMANQTLDDDTYIASVLPPGARASSAYPASYPTASSAQKLPPGLSNSNHVEAPAAPHYKQLFGLSGGAASAAAPVAPAVGTAAPPNLTKTTPGAPSISYARALAPPASQQTPSASQQALLPPPGVGVGHLPYPVSHQAMGPPPGVTGPDGAFISAQPAYMLNPPQPPVSQPAGILRGTSLSSTQSGATIGSAHTHSSAFSAQKPLLFNSATGFSTPAAGSIPPGKGATPAQQHRKELPRGKYMSPSDVRYVVNKVLQPMESTDPFADDFYFLQLSIKKNAAAREAAVKEEAPMPNSIYVPLPVWKETRERIKLQMDSTRRQFHDKSREWETKEQVLGHQVRSDIHRPREQLRMPSMQELDQYNAADLADDEELGSELKSPFSSRLWTMRQAVQRGYEALYTVQELQHLLSSPLIATNPVAHGEICREIESAVSLLSQAIGIRTLSSSPQPPSLGMLGTEEQPDFSLDGGHVGAILQTTIGKKLMTRSLKLLTPPHRWALLPVILAKILLSPPAADPAGSSSSSGAANEALAVEQRLLRTIIEFLQYSYQYQIDQQRQVPPGAVAVFTNILLTNLRQCIKSVMVTQMEKSKLRQALISERTRAEVMHMIVQIGDKVSVLADRKLSEEWVQTREAFMSMLDN